ncbi:MAG: hypothetical protein K940chlam2_00383 [Chlamydiae bacterium]|nr:hypothetical protein [Chlamydiota bacterium]
MGQPIGFADFFLAASRVEGWDSEIIVEDGRVIPVENKSQETCLEKARWATWQAFEQAVSSLFPGDRLGDILHKYSFPLGDMARDGTFALVQRMVNKIATGAALPSVVDLSQLATRELIVMTPQEIGHTYNEACRAAYLAPSTAPLSDVRGGPKQAHEYLIQDFCLQDKKLVSLLQGVQHLDWETYMERLTMAINGHEIPEGTVIPAPGFPKGSPDFYEVYQVVAGKGLYAIALKPCSFKSALPPLLCFRCTQSSLGAIDAVHTWTNNAQKNIGEKGYTACKEALTELLQDRAFNPNGKITLAAYSLGGAHGGLFFRDHWRSVDNAYFYRSVHNTEGVAEQLASEINQLPPAFPGPSIYIDRVTGDWASYAGYRHVGHGITHLGTWIRVREFDLGFIPKNFAEWFNLHSMRALDLKAQPPKRLYFRDELFHELDNKLRGETIKQYEKLRRTLGDKILYYVFEFFYRIFGFIFDLMGIRIFRSSDNAG